MSCTGLSGESLKKCKAAAAKAAAKKKKSTTEIDFSKATTDLNSSTFKNKDVQTWQNKASAQKRGVRSPVTGLKNLGQTISAPRLTKKKR